MALPTCSVDVYDATKPTEDDSIFCIQAEIRALKAYLAEQGSAQFYPGSYVNYLGNIAPPGWIFAGQDVSRAEYPELFAVLGTAYGEGDGSTTFGLPNLALTDGSEVATNYSDMPFASSGAGMVQLVDGRLLYIGRNGVINECLIGTITDTDITWEEVTTLLPAWPSPKAQVFLEASGTVLVTSALWSYFYRGTVTGTSITWALVLGAVTPAALGFIIQGTPRNFMYLLYVSSGIRFLYRYDVNGLGLAGPLALSPASGLLSMGGGMSATMLSPTKILLTGGWNSGYTQYTTASKILDISNLSLVTITDCSPLPAALIDHVIRVLPDGKLLLIGGKLYSGGPHIDSYIGTITGSYISWAPITSAQLSLPADFNAFAHCELATGEVLIAGGAGGITVLDDVIGYRTSRVIIKT